MEKFVRLLQPGNIGKLELKNRIVMPPTVTNYANIDGTVTERLIDFYAERAKGGAGLIIVECTKAESFIESFVATNLLRISTDQYITGFQDLTEAVHLNGAKIALQVTPASGAWVVPPETWPPGYQSISPTKFACPGAVPHELTTDEVENLVEFYGKAARRVKLAGFDAIEIHGHASYLLAMFMSPYVNTRTDKYGDLLRLPLELVQAVKSYAGDDFPIIFRYSVDEFIKGGRDLAGSKAVAKRLEAAGVHAIDVSAGTYYTPESLWVFPPMAFPHGCFVHLAEGIKQTVKIPIIVPGKLFDPLVAERVLQEGKADFIGIARGLIADPEWPKKVAEGKVEDIRKCIACNEGCIQRAVSFQAITCSVNAMVGKERRYKIESATEPKKVLVVGGGPGGMEAARVAALRGHEVTLWEKEQELGGQLVLASKAEGKSDIIPLIKWLSAQVGKAGVKIELRKEATPKAIVEAKPDVVIVATGAIGDIPEIPGIEKSIVITALDVLREKAKIGQEVVVLGGGLVGCDVALFLAERGKRVTMIVRSDIAFDIEENNRAAILTRLTQRGVKWFTYTKTEEITEKGVIAANQQGRQNFQADTVVVATGLKPRKELYKALKDRVPELYAIGDCIEARKILNAIHEGFFIANRI
jgi:2,4-dienoyl-CoA reductase-like NADH-dependent reductase (Old Yellow Enzyme family)/thioredoxin reductase